MKKLAQAILFILLNQPLLAGHKIDYNVMDPGNGGFDGSACWKSYNNEIIFSGKLNQRGKNEKKQELAFSLISKDSLFIQNIIKGNDTLSDTLYWDKDQGLTNLLEVIKTELNIIKTIEPESKEGFTENEYRIVTKDGPVKVKTKHTYSLSGKAGLLSIKSEKGYLVKDLLNYLFIYPSFSSADYIVECIGGDFDAAFIGKKNRIIKFVYEGLKPISEGQE